LSEVVCACCGRQHADLRAQKSRLLDGTKFMVCPSCKRGGFEPRYIIILVARSEGTDKVAEYIRDHKYHGEPILGREMIA
jgi:hypothetical protein